MTRDELIAYAEVLFNGCDKEENPEYLRALVELIGYATQGENEDTDELNAQIEAKILN